MARTRTNFPVSLTTKLDPSKINSSTLSTTTRIGIFQFAEVNVTLVVAKETSVRSPLEKLISTLDEGIAVRTTEKLTEFRGCSVKFPLIGPRTKSPISLSFATSDNFFW